MLHDEQRILPNIFSLSINMICRFIVTGFLIFLKDYLSLNLEALGLKNFIVFDWRFVPPVNEA